MSQSFVSGILTESRDYYYSDGWQVLEERVEEGLADRQFVWGLRYIDDLLLRDRDTTGGGTLDERLFAPQDPNWNVTALSDPTGTVVERYGYSAYGQPVFLDGSYSAITASSYDVDVLYCGYRWDAIVGSYAVRNRVLWSHLGRWDHRDPIEYSAGSASLYSLVGNDPIAYLDPLGLTIVRPRAARTTLSGPTRTISTRYLHYDSDRSNYKLNLDTGEKMLGNTGTGDFVSAKQLTKIRRAARGKGLWPDHSA